MRPTVGFALVLAAGLVSPDLFASCLTVTCPANKSVACSVGWSFDAPTVVTNPTPQCLAAGCVSYTITVLSTVTNGTCQQYNITRTWVITDPCESHTCNQTVSVLNTNQPVFLGVADLAPLTCTTTQVYYNVTATEACCGNLPVTCSPPSGSYFTPWVTTFVTCTTTDCCGRAFSKNFSVFPRLMTNEPVFQGAESIVLSSCTSTQVYYNVTAAEPFCGSLPVTCSPPSGFTFPAGVVTFVDCTTTDCCGRNYTKEFYVYPIQPSILAAYCTDQYVAFGDTNWTFDPPSVYDSCCPGNYSFFPQPPITNQASGPLIITEVWGVTDACGQSNYCTQTVYVTNTLPNVTNYSIAWHKVSGGGGTSTGGIYSVSGTIGQPDAGKMIGGNSEIDGGFWSIIAAAQSSNAPQLTITRTTPNTVRISWPSASAGFVLQQNGDLRTTSWVNTSQPPADDGTTKSVLINPPTGNLYFRLKK